MPFDVENPPEKIRGLSEKKQRQWISVFNSCWEEHEDDAICHRMAWGVVKKAGEINKMQRRKLARKLLEVAKALLGAKLTDEQEFVLDEVKKFPRNYYWDGEFGYKGDPLYGGWKEDALNALMSQRLIVTRGSKVLLTNRGEKAWSESGFGRSASRMAAKEILSGVTGPTRMQLQKYYDSLIKGGMKMRPAIQKTEKAFKVNNIRLNQSGTIVNFKTAKVAQHLLNVKTLESLTDRELTRAIRDAIIAEEDAIKQYETVVDSTENEKAKEVLQEIADEEKVHVGELQALLSTMLPDEDELLEEGAEEVREGNDRDAKKAARRLLEMARDVLSPATKPMQKLGADIPLEGQVIDFLVKNPNPPDSKVHEWAEKNGWEVDDVEAAIYKLATNFARIMKGGRSKGEKADVDPKELKMGIKVEVEHVDDKVVAEKISRDHLAEIPNYYTLLKKMEEGAGVEH